MNKQDLVTEIYDELDMIRLMSKLAEFAVINNSKIGLDM